MFAGQRFMQQCKRGTLGSANPVGQGRDRGALDCSLRGGSRRGRGVSVDPSVRTRRRPSPTSTVRARISITTRARTSRAARAATLNAPYRIGSTTSSDGVRHRRSGRAGSRSTADGSRHRRQVISRMLPVVNSFAPQAQTAMRSAAVAEAPAGDNVSAAAAAVRRSGYSGSPSTSFRSPRVVVGNGRTPGTHVPRPPGPRRRSRRRPGTHRRLCPPVPRHARGDRDQHSAAAAAAAAGRTHPGRRTGPRTVRHRRQPIPSPTRWPGSPV